MEINIELSNLLTNYFSRYANHIVYERAIPSLNDGLKPVQRRVLMSMNNLGLAPNKTMKKCAKIVGDTVGQYHPHSLDGPYGALVNMTATFSCRYPLGDGSGNMGSIQGDPPAAFRYTEAKLSNVGDLLLNQTDKEIVSWVPTYDNSGVEPVSLGGLFPNILCNYTNGIAAGVSSMIPSHNATEVYTALIKTIDRITKGKDIDVDFLLKYIKGPDFPTGGIIINDSDISSAYKNGKGKFIIRGEYTIKNKKELVFHSIPYTTNLSVIVKNLKKLREQKLCGEFKDVSAKGNVELIIKPARGQSVDNLIENVFKKTKLEDNFNSIFTMIYNNKVYEHMSLDLIIKKLLIHYHNIIKAKYTVEKNNNDKLLFKYNTVKITVHNSEEILNIIKDDSDPRSKLKEKLKINNEAVDYIMSMKINDFTKLSQKDYDSKIKKLNDRNTELSGILRDANSVLLQVKIELQSILKKYFKDDKRLTTIGLK